MCAAAFSEDRIMLWRGLFITLCIVPMATSPVSAQSTSRRDSWSGTYLGGGLALSWGQGSWRSEGPGDDNARGRFDYFQPFDAFTGTGSYSAAIQAGRDWRLPSGIVFGVVTDVQVASHVQGHLQQATPAVGQARIAEDVAIMGTVRSRLGVVRNDWLWYGTAGWAWTWNTSTRDQLSGTPIGGAAISGTSEVANIFRSGYTVGAGVELPVSSDWTASFEYLFTSFGNAGARFPEGAQRITSDLDLHTVRAGLNYRIGVEPASKDPSLAQSSRSLDWSAHAQTTYVQQYALPFRAPYAGANSLIPNQTRQTWDATFFLGMRPWKGGELWLNPEIDQGFGLAGSLGLAGFSSGEAYKVGSEHPYARIHRSFLRQTFNISGEAEKIEDGPNQLAGTQLQNRVVLTVGKFGATDIFDSNRYAHDPRSDFLNWSIIDMGSFDYAADAWGYTYGVAAEYYMKGWAFRLGLFDLPTVPNSTVLDPTFGQFQWIGEIERLYELMGNPGKIAVTGFLTRARMGRFADATAIAGVSGQPADIAGVRNFRSRGGVGFNLEQQLTPAIGLFVRAGWADGSSEPFAFTDIDKSAAAGLVFDGKLWNRPDHSVGVAGVVNAISREHRDFLNAGGLGILVGDGQLARASGERILEAYYAFPLGGMRLTFDYQYVVNPAYNEDRGPVSIIGTRLRKQF
ncbi:MAG: porin [Hyphomicrobiales bacterium]|nr:MAG: porin [Hyphomicrobiales bacterium]